MRRYLVKKGDTLTGIAHTELGDAEDWPELWRINQRAIEAAQYDRGGERREVSGGSGRVFSIAGPDFLFAGTTLLLPEKDAAG